MMRATERPGSVTTTRGRRAWVAQSRERSGSRSRPWSSPSKPSSGSGPDSFGVWISNDPTFRIDPESLHFVVIGKDRRGGIQLALESPT